MEGVFCVAIAWRTIKCEVCGCDIPDWSRRCPNCLHDIGCWVRSDESIRTSFNGKILFFIVLVVLSIIAGKYFLDNSGGSSQEDLFKDKPQNALGYYIYTSDAILDNVKHMLSEGKSEFSVATVDSNIHGWCDLYLDVIQRYPEFYYDEVERLYINGTLNVKFKSALNEKDRKSYIDTAITIAKQVSSELYSDGVLTDGMSDTEKARVYYDWIINNCECVFGDDSTLPYGAVRDVPLEERLISSAYGVFVKNRSNPMGYVSAYNILLRLEGIDCFGFIDDSQHIWSRAVLDGKTLDIDSYYEDSTGEYDKYFCMPYEFAMRHYDDIE